MLHVHRSERADALVDALAEVLRVPPADPFAAEVVAVPAKGVERWITQRLSHVLGRGHREDGVCANVRFPSPARLVRECLVAAGGAVADDEPWTADRMLWPLLEVIDRSIDEDWCSTLAGYLGAAGAAGGRRLPAARHIVRLYDSYGASRPGLFVEWRRGEDTDGAGSALPAELRWQAELWRRLRQEIGSPSLAERLGGACATLQGSPELLDLPERLSVFGPTRLSVVQRRVLTALAHGREVHLWLPHPSPVQWARLAAQTSPGGFVRRRDDRNAPASEHPLLASLGRDARELQVLLAGCEVETVDVNHPTATRPATLLGELQKSIALDATPGHRRPLDPADRSLQVHSCHGPPRQVEVLREVLVGLLAADPTLEPRDVLVMCPDIENFAPLISAAFGLEDDPGSPGHPGHRLRVRLADRSLRQTNPLLAVLATLLDLAGGRVKASEVLDLAAAAPVRRRFRFSDDDLERLQDWIAASGARWGLDQTHRTPFGLGAVGQNTWQAGLDRILLGAAMTGDDTRWVGLALPLDDVDSGDVDLAGRLAELIARLTSALDGMLRTAPLTDWVAHLSASVESLTLHSDADEWQRAQLRHELGQLVVDAGSRAGTTEMTLGDVRALLADRLAGRPTRANFRTGTLTVCSMVPMRSVPHRVICLLGLDDGAFPRTSGVNGDDVLARDPCVGERDPRSEDRQLLLDAVMSAQEHLVILFTGADPRTNARRPPAVPVGEILDAVDSTVDTADGRRASEHVLIRHPLQPFDQRNFIAGALGGDGPFSFDRHALRGAARAVLPREQPGPFLRAPLVPLDPAADVALEDVIAFLEQPVRAFLKQRLLMSLPYDEEEPADALCVELDNLGKWALGDRLLQARLAGGALENCKQAEWRRGTLPPGALGRDVLEELAGRVERLVGASADARALPSRTVDVAVRLSGRRLTGTVAALHRDDVVRVVYSSLGAKHRLRAWAQVLALTTWDPSTAWRALTIGRGKGGEVRRSTLGPIDPSEAARWLHQVVDLWERGSREPLPMAAKTSGRYAEKRHAGMAHANALAAARQEWSSDQMELEQAEPAHTVVWGERPGIEVLEAAAPRVDEEGAGWPMAQTTRFGALALRLWEPLLAAEQLDTL